MLKEFAAKKCDKLGKLLKERGVLRLEMKKDVVSLPPAGKPKPVIRKCTPIVVIYSKLSLTGVDG